jgi:xanthine dehydrogenase accessory factor
MRQGDGKKSLPEGSAAGLSFPLAISRENSMTCFSRTVVLIRGAGDLASGVAVRLRRCGFPVVMTELPQPLTVRRTVAFGEAVYEGEIAVEGIVARRAPDVAAARVLLPHGIIPILVDPLGSCRRELNPGVLVDGVMAKHNTGTTIADAPLVIALGPGFTAGVDCHAVVETNRGHWLGRVIWQGPAHADTGLPAEIAGRQADRVLRAPADGVIETAAAIGDRLTTGELIAIVGDREVRALFDGVLRGLIRPGLFVTAGLKIGDLDPRAEPAHCFTISDKSLAVAGGVLEAILGTQ